jgi:hypothetical protein
VELGFIECNVEKGITYPVFVCVRNVSNFRRFWKNNKKAQRVPLSIA